MIYQLLLLITTFSVASSWSFGPKAVVDPSKNSIFDFDVQYGGKEVSLSTFRGKSAYLVVNVASK
jgi:hypothetical protein